jgi:tRNA 2-thiouridine synthesizing protein A
MDYELARSKANICRIFGSARRVMILWALVDGEMSVGEIASAIDTSLQNTSQHLRLMQDKGILESRRAGSSVYYRICNGPMEGCRLLTQPLEEPAKTERTSNFEIGIRSFTMSTDELNTVEAAKVVDARGSACPGPLLEAKKGVGTIKVGEILEIWSGDARTKEDIPRWSKKVGHEFLGHLVAEGGYDRIFIKRAK